MFDSFATYIQSLSYHLQFLSQLSISMTLLFHLKSKCFSYVFLSKFQVVSSIPNVNSFYQNVQHQETSSITYYYSLINHKTHHLYCLQQSSMLFCCFMILITNFFIFLHCLDFVYFNPRFFYHYFLIFQEKSDLFPLILFETEFIFLLTQHDRFYLQFQ